MIPREEEEIQQYPPRAAISSGEGMDILKPGMEVGGFLEKFRPAVTADLFHQLVQFPAHISGGCTNGVDCRHIILLFEFSGPFSVGQVNGSLKVPLVRTRWISSTRGVSISSRALPVPANTHSNIFDYREETGALGVPGKLGNRAAAEHLLSNLQGQIPAFQKSGFPGKSGIEIPKQPVQISGTAQLMGLPLGNSLEIVAHEEVPPFQKFNRIMETIIQGTMPKRNP